MDLRITQDFSGRAILEAMPGVEGVETIAAKIGIPCILCGKILETDSSYYWSVPVYICDECKEAVAYAKQLRTRAKCDPLEAILD